MRVTHFSLVYDILSSWPPASRIRARGVIGLHSCFVLNYGEDRVSRAREMCEGSNGMPPK
jgi:hypothetical protein